MNTPEPNAREALSDCRWHLKMAADALTAAGRERPLLSIDFDNARQQLQQVAATLPRLPR